MRKDAPGGKLLDAHVPLINAVADAFGLPWTANGWVQTDLSIPDFADAAVAQIRAVFEVEASGAGWSTDMRGDILALPRRLSRRIVSAQDPVRGPRL